MTNNEKSGFTLIELLIVIAIIAILSTIGVVSYNNIQKNARDAARKADLDAVVKALETNKKQTGYQPLVSSQFSGRVPAADSRGNQYCIGYDNNPVTSAPGVWTGNCPGVNWVALPDNPTGEPAYWKICAVLENPSSVYCISSSQ